MAADVVLPVELVHQPRKPLICEQLLYKGLLDRIVVNIQLDDDKVLRPSDGKQCPPGIVPRSLGRVGGHVVVVEAVQDLEGHRPGKERMRRMKRSLPRIDARKVNTALVVLLHEPALACTTRPGGVDRRPNVKE
eukprot:CAMPEP_0197880472 /NCGR_PEP_ID=MMETSP1439-20131203/8272_1 /TAXON_ID=66791 /ORGANISM="Gonyaulax spinifera, Strain CCMP409" /LENGTH=133 /DNA_ID=CAMNT_0043500027 /DNA_START=53 /DNA_END=454 /DNA_ORIENTATION=-